jgi:hypothetical protein
MIDYLYDKLGEASDYFNKKLTVQIEHERQLTEEKIKSLDSQIDELKKLRNQDRDESDMKIKELSNEKAQLIANLKNLEETLITEREEFSNERKTNRIRRQNQ